MSFCYCHVPKYFAFNTFMRWGVKSLLEVQNKCVNLSSFVQDYYPIIYNSGQPSFTAVPFPKCMLPVGKKLIFIQVSHDIRAYYMFKLHGIHVSDTGRYKLQARALSHFLKRGQMFARSHSLGISPVSRDCWKKCVNPGPSSLNASSFRSIGWSSSGPTAFEGFKPLSNLITPSEYYPWRGRSSG